MKPVEKTTTHREFVCERCGESWNNPHSAIECERGHANLDGFKPGMVITWTEWQHGSEMGRDTQYSVEMTGTVIRVNQAEWRGAVLVEQKNGIRSWVPGTQVCSITR